jgi:hypothetical protein
MTSFVPTYSVEGKRLRRDRTLASVQALLAVGLVTVVRDRKGNVKRAIMHYGTGKPAVLKTAYLGTKYSYREHLRDGHSCYNLRKLGGNDPKGDDYLAPIFWAVVTSCTSNYGRAF